MRQRSTFLFSALCFGFAFFYIPIISMIVFSFNKSRLATVWGIFPLHHSRIINKTFADGIDFAGGVLKHANALPRTAFVGIAFYGSEETIGYGGHYARMSCATAKVHNEQGTGGNERRIGYGHGRGYPYCSAYTTCFCPMV